MVQRWLGVRASNVKILAMSSSTSLLLCLLLVIVVVVFYNYYSIVWCWVCHHDVSTLLAGEFIRATMRLIINKRNAHISNQPMRKMLLEVPGMCC